MKKILGLLIATILVFLCACGSPAAVPEISSNPEPAVSAEPVPVETPEEAEVPAETEPVEEAPIPEEDSIDEPTWDELKAQGLLVTEDGVDCSIVTMPAMFSEGATQEALDSSAGDAYVEATLNPDKSVTYKFTKKQHKEMVDYMRMLIANSCIQMASSQNNTITIIDPTDDFSTFEVTLSGNQLNAEDVRLQNLFYELGHLFGAFSNHDKDTVTVNFYGPDGTLITSVNSAG